MQKNGIYNYEVKYMDMVPAWNLLVVFFAGIVVGILIMFNISLKG